MTRDYDPQLIDELRQTALAMADAAAGQSLKWFRRADLSAGNKADQGFDPVTQADKAAETAMRAVLADMRPQDAILGEEAGYKPGTSGLTWVLDPIDGTRGYLSGTPTWVTLIACSDDQGPFIGVVDQPYLRERYIGTPQSAVMERDGQTTPLIVRTTTALKDAILFSTFPEVGTKAEETAFHSLAPQCRLVRYGMDCYANALLAAGQIDLVVEAGLHPYDIQGPMALVQAAGGVVTNWSGGDPSQGGQIIYAATPELHRAALAYLQPYADVPMRMYK